MGRIRPPVVEGEPTHALLSCGASSHFSFPVNHKVALLKALTCSCLPARVRSDWPDDINVVVVGTALQSGHVGIAGVDKMLGRQQVLLLQRSVERFKHAVVLHRGRRGQHIHDEMGRICVAGLGDVRLVAGPFHSAFDAVASLNIVGRFDEQAGGVQAGVE